MRGKFLADPALKEILVRIDGVVVGHITPAGRYLEVEAFRRLHAAARLRAYLGLVAPAPRRTSTLARVCGCAGEDIANLLRGDRLAGRITRPARGLYQLHPEAWT